MNGYMRIHPESPQPRLIARAVEVLVDRGVIVYPTDSCYALACRIGDREAQDRLQRIRSQDRHRFMTLVCRDLSDIGTYAKVSNQAYRLVKSLTPGPYTFLLPATREVPRRLQQSRRKTIGLRVPDNPIANELLTQLGEPVLSTSLILPGENMPLTDPQEIYERLQFMVDLVIDGGAGGYEMTTVIDLMSSEAVLVRQGKGKVSLS